jgi:DNA repair ATPase RecN
MKEISDRIDSLKQAYEAQLDGYKQLYAFGIEERRLIESGNIEDLLVLLHKKSEIVQDINRYTQKIQETQEFLKKFFNLSEFTLEQVKQTASKHYLKKISELEAVIKEVVQRLENLERQEREHEGMLRELIEARNINVSPPNIQAKIKKAYKIK